jgi:hypothetical protein
MTRRWKERMERLGRANEKAREDALQSLTLERAARVLEELLSHPAVPPSQRLDHPVSLSRRMRRRHV